MYPVRVVAWTVASMLLLIYVPGVRSTTTACSSFPFNPWLLNAVVLGDVGSASINYANTDIEGAAVVLGNGYFTGFDFNWVRTWTPTNIGLYVGGSLTFTNGQAAGGMEIAGNAYFTSSSVGTPVSGPVSVGGSLSGGSGGGTITGNLVVAGMCSWCSNPSNSLASGYTTTIGGTFTPTLNLTCIESYFQAVSPYLDGADTASYSIPSTGVVTVILPSSPTLNYVTIPATILSGANTVNINGTSASHELVINVIETTVTLANTLQFNYNTITNGNVLVNMPNCATLTLGGSYNMNLLAPFAVTGVTWSHITGNIIVKSLQPGSGGGMMQINDAVYCTISALPSACPDGVCGSPAATGSRSPSPSPAGPASPSQSLLPPQSPTTSPQPPASPSPVAAQSPAASQSPDSSMSPLASQSPAPSRSPVPLSSPFTSPVASPVPFLSNQTCAAALGQYLGQYEAFNAKSCTSSFIDTIRQTYNCSETTSGCGIFLCSIPMPADVASNLSQCELA